MEEARASRPVARCRSGSSTSAIAIPARAASIRAPTSQPKPAASGKQTARASEEKTRWPESGSAGTKPERARINARAARAIPKPPPCRSAKTAIKAALGGRERSEVAGQIRVAHDDGARRCFALGERQRLALAARREAQNASSRPFRRLRGSVGRAVVGDDHLGAGELFPQLLDRRPDALGLVSSRYQDRGRLSHQEAGRAAAARSARAASRRRPSS